MSSVLLSRSLSVTLYRVDGGTAWVARDADAGIADADSEIATGVAPTTAEASTDVSAAVAEWLVAERKKLVGDSSQEV